MTGTVYHRNPPGVPRDPAERIAEVVFEALTAERPRVRYQITPDRMRHFMTATLPKRVVDRIIAKRLGLLPQG